MIVDVNYKNKQEGRKKETVENEQQYAIIIIVVLRMLVNQLCSHGMVLIRC